MAQTGVILVTRVARGHAYWDARWWDPRTGKRRSRSLGRCDKVSARQARRLVARIEHEFDLDPQARSSDGPPELGEWLNLFIDRQTALGRKPTTIRDYQTVRQMLEMFFGERRKIDTISKFDLEQFRLALSNGKLKTVFTKKRTQRAGPTTVAKYMRNTKTIFTAAYNDDLLPRNPAVNLKLAQPPAQSWFKVDAKTFWQLYGAVDGDTPRDRALRLLLAVARLAGLRKSDALALKWQNVRWEEGVLCFRPIKVERFATRDARVPICAELLEILTAERNMALRLDEFVIPRALPIKLGDRVFPRLFKKADLTIWDKPLHTLRKSCIDDWAKMAPPNVVMEWATHASLATTMKYYTKVSPADEMIGKGSLLENRLLSVGS